MSKLILPIILWVSFSAALWADPSTTPKGVMILTSASGSDPRNVLFDDQVWTDFYGGNVIDTDGQKSVFAKRDIGKIVYFDSHYYSHLDNDQQQAAFREGIQAREIVVNTSFLNLDATKDIRSLQDGKGTFESVAHEYPAIQSLIQPQQNLLKDYIARLSSGQSLVNGKWMSQQEAVTQITPSVIGEIPKTLSFTTKDGKSFVNVRISITDTGLSILTSDGGASVPFDQLPDDISVFPDAIQKAVSQDRRKHLAQSQNLNISSADDRSSPPAASATEARDQKDATRFVEKSGSGPQETLPADSEEARLLIEHQLGQSSIGSVLPDARKPTVRIEKDTGHIYVDNYLGSQDCLLSSLDGDSIVVRTDGALLIFTKDHERTVKKRFISSEENDHLEFPGGVPQQERFSKAFRFLIESYSPKREQNTLASTETDLRDKLCKELRSALSASSVTKFDVLYNKSTETLAYYFVDQGVYVESAVPLRIIDPQGITWDRSGINPSKLILTTIDNKQAIRRDQIYAVKDHYILNAVDINFPSETDAAQFAQTLTQLCKQLGWSPTKF